MHTGQKKDKDCGFCIHKFLSLKKRNTRQEDHLLSRSSANGGGERVTSQRDVKCFLRRAREEVLAAVCRKVIPPEESQERFETEES